MMRGSSDISERSAFSDRLDSFRSRIKRRKPVVVCDTDLGRLREALDATLWLRRSSLPVPSRGFAIEIDRRDPRIWLDGKPLCVFEDHNLVLPINVTGPDGGAVLPELEDAYRQWIREYVHPRLIENDWIISNRLHRTEEGWLRWEMWRGAESFPHAIELIRWLRTYPTIKSASPERVTRWLAEHRLNLN